MEVTGPAATALESFDRWDTYPPAQGRIRFSNSTSSAETVEADFRVVLVEETDGGVLLAASIDAYVADGIPVVPVETELAPQNRAEAVTLAQGFEGLRPDSSLVWCDHLLIEITNVSEPDVGRRHDVDDDIRVAGLAGALTTPVSPREGSANNAERAALFRSPQVQALSETARLAVVFLLQEEDEELEVSRSEIQADDVDLLAALYWLLPTWSQRAALVYLIQDHQGDISAAAIRMDVLSAPVQHGVTVRTIAQAAALAWLQGDIERMEFYLENPSRLDVDRALWSSLRWRSPET